MYRVLIIDDNIYLLESLSKSIKWDLYKCNLVGIAKDGKEGLRLMNQYSPDIIISDIRMPEMDGLSMLEMIRKGNPDCKIIIISAYEEFCYAKRAIHLNVVDYLTKPIRIPTMQNILIATVKLLDEERDRGAWDQQSYLYSIRQQFLYNLITENSSPNEIDEQLKLTELIFSAYMACVIITRGMPDVIQNAFKIELKKVKKIDCPIIIDTCHEGKIILWIFFKDAAINGQATDFIYNFLKILFKSIDGAEQHYVISPFSYDNISKVPEMYCRLDEIISQLAFGRVSESSGFDEFLHINRIELQGNMARYKKLLFSADINNDMDISGILSELIDSICKISDYDQFTIKMLVCRFLLNYIDELIRFDESVDTNQYIAKIANIPDIITLKKIFNEIVTEIIKIHALNNKGYSPIVSKSLELIRNNASKPITLNSLAEKLSINPSYLSVTIKKETGRNYQDFLQKARVELAKELLAQSKYPVNEIAGIVQYKNYISFYKTFKRTTGVSPKEYQQLCKTELWEI